MLALLLGFALQPWSFPEARGAGLRIYTEEWPPVTYSSPEGVAGFAVDVVREIQKNLGDATPIELVSWSRGYGELLSRPNILLFTVGASEERKKQMTLVGPVALCTIDLWALKEKAPALRTLGEAVKSRPVGAYRSSIFADSARKNGFTALDLAATPQATARKLFEGRVEMWSEGSVVVPSVLKEIGHTTDEVEKITTLDTIELYLAFSRGTPGAVVDEWEKAFREIKGDGTFARISQKWLPGQPVPKEVRRVGLEP